MQKFTATEFTTAEEKAKFADKFQKFILKGCPRKQFTKAFYTRLSNCFGHIAHYNIDGFYAEWFADLVSRRRFVDHCLQWPCYGDPTHSFSDVERYLQQWLKDAKIHETLKEYTALEKEQAELKLRDELIAKHGLPPYEVTNKA